MLKNILRSRAISKALKLISSAYSEHVLATFKCSLVPDGVEVSSGDLTCTLTSSEIRDLSDEAYGILISHGLIEEAK